MPRVTPRTTSPRCSTASPPPTPGLAVRYGRDLAVDPLLLRAAAERIEAAHEPGDAPPAESLLVVVGRGTSDPDANSNIAKVTRMLWEGLGFAWAETCYSGVTTPLVGPALARIAGFGFPRIVVFPYFLFTGVLVRRIYDAVDEAARAHPGIAFRKAGYLNDHPLVVDAFLARIAEIPEGDNRMNCRLCKYREQIIGHEGDLGAPQVGHHHHVEGIGTDADHDGAHGHGHHHAHDHHHHMARTWRRALTTCATPRASRGAPSPSSGGRPTSPPFPQVWWTSPIAWCMPPA